MTTLVLRPYQVQLSADTDQAFAQGAGGVCAVLPTGGGKTAIIATRLQRFVSRGERVGVVAHRTDLIEQTIKTLHRAGVTSIGAVAAKLPHLRADNARVQVASLQTLLARGTTLPLDRIVLDEAHHYADDSRWGAFAEAYGHVPREGYTATPQRGDGRGLRGAFDALAVGPSVAELTALGHLVPARVHAPPIHLGGRLAQDPVQFWLAHGCAGKRTLWFARSKVHGAELEQATVAAGYPAQLIHEGTPRTAVRRAFAQYLAQPTQLPVLTNVFLMTEGTDLPATEVIGLARACDEDITYLQAVGRGLRPSEGKTECVVLDMGGATRKHGGPWKPRTYSLDGKGIVASEAPDDWQCEACGLVAPRPPPGEPCPFCGHVVPKQERAQRPAVTGDAMYMITADADELAARQAAEDAAAEAAQARAAEDAAAAKKTRLMRHQLGPRGVADLASGLSARLAQWHARADARQVRR